MGTTNATLQEYTATSSGCDNDWCDGPDSDTLPCFACFDPRKDYDTAGTATIDDDDEGRA